MAARSITREEIRVDALVGLAPHLSAGVLGEALAVVQRMALWKSCGKGLTGLAPYLPTELLGQALAAARRIEHREIRVDALSALATRLVTFPRPALDHWWLGEQENANLLHFLARRTRENLLNDLLALAPVIAALGGEQAIVETFRAIQDVGRWWP